MVTNHLKNGNQFREWISRGWKKLPPGTTEATFLRENEKRVAVSVHIVHPDSVEDGNKFKKLQDSDMGSGFVVTKEGHIMTCSRVVRCVIEEGRILFITYEEEPDVFREAMVLYDEPGSDVAILLLKEVDRAFDFCKFGSKEDIIIGNGSFFHLKSAWL